MERENNMDQLRGADILIAEDHTLVRQGFVSLLSSKVNSIQEASNGQEALDLLQTESFDMALIDIGLPELSGLQVLEEIRKSDLSTKIIVLTGDTMTHAPADIYDAGADAFVYKTTETQHLIEVLSDVIDGNRPATEMAGVGNAVHSQVRKQYDDLTVREKQILKMIVEGLSNREIADKLFISQHTVRKHREHINKKLDTKSPAAMARFAISCGLI